MLLVKQSTISELNDEIARSLELKSISTIYNSVGARITTVEVIRDGDVLYASLGEAFHGKLFVNGETVAYSVLDQVTRVLSLLSESNRPPAEYQTMPILH